MTFDVSADTKAILLLTAPLIAGRGKPSVKLLAAGEYRRLARRLRDLKRRPADLLESGAREIAAECRSDLDPERLERLLDRGFRLTEAVERWRTRAIWVRSRADADYPRRLKRRLGEHAPPVFYGCGDAAVLRAGGLAVVGSRNVDDALSEYTEKVGRLVASAGRCLVSGGARGVDRAAMRGSLDAGGRAAGILADGLERAAMLRENREALMDGRLVLTSPYDPAARFHVGQAMQRNKLIYALSDAALVVNSDYGKGGTWAGAVEQLDKLKLVPVYVRADDEAGKGLEGLRERGAKPWPEPTTPEALEDILDAASDGGGDVPGQQTLSIAEADSQAMPPAPARTSEPGVATDISLADELFAKVRELVERMDGLRTKDTVAEALHVSKTQAGVWLGRFTEAKIREQFKDPDVCMTEAGVKEAIRIESKVRACLTRLVKERVLEQLPGRPVKYRSSGSMPLFGQRD